jgi:phosphoribosylanthranilate isomerase
MLVKICGLTNRDDAEAAIAAGADLIGFVFVPGTPRAVDPERASWIAELEQVDTVGVFRDAPLDHILLVRDRLGLDRVQLHGDEPDDLLDLLGPATIRRVPPSADFDWHVIERLAARCLPLLDPGGGDGVAWPWRRLGTPPPSVRFGLAGGLTPETVADAVAALDPWLVDVSSGVELRQGFKDHAKVRAFIANARAASVHP